LAKTPNAANPRKKRCTRKRFRMLYSMTRSNCLLSRSRQGVGDTGFQAVTDVPDSPF